MQIPATVANAEIYAIECRGGGGACPCLVRGCFCSERCKCGTQKQHCTNVLGGPGSKLSEQLGIERIEIATAESDEGVETSVSIAYFFFCL